MADKNDKYVYAGVAAVAIILLICWTGQPLKFLQTTKILTCPGCAAGGAPSGGSGCDGWDYQCNSTLAVQITNRCCTPPTPVPTCARNDITGSCGGTCPIPNGWNGWTSACEPDYPILLNGNEREPQFAEKILKLDSGYKPGSTLNLISYYPDACSCHYYPPGYDVPR
jgi:hypothetical protein